LPLIILKKMYSFIKSSKSTGEENEFDNSESDNSESDTWEDDEKYPNDEKYPDNDEKYLSNNDGLEENGNNVEETANTPEEIDASSLLRNEEEEESIIEQLNKRRPIPLPLEFVEKSFEFEEGGEDFDTAFTDFVFPGVGWISATGKSKDKLLFRASGFSVPHVRDPIMPLEANRTGRKARGYVKHGKLANYSYTKDDGYVKE